MSAHKAPSGPDLRTAESKSGDQSAEEIAMTTIEHNRFLCEKNEGETSLSSGCEENSLLHNLVSSSPSPATRSDVESSPPLPSTLMPKPHRDRQDNPELEASNCSFGEARSRRASDNPTAADDRSSKITAETRETRSEATLTVSKQGGQLEADRLETNQIPEEKASASNMNAKADPEKSTVSYKYTSSDQEKPTDQRKTGKIKKAKKKKKKKNEEEDVSTATVENPKSATDNTPFNTEMHSEASDSRKEDDASGNKNGARTKIAKNTTENGSESAFTMISSEQEKTAELVKNAANGKITEDTNKNDAIHGGPMTNAIKARRIAEAVDDLILRLTAPLADCAITETSVIKQMIEHLSSRLEKESLPGGRLTEMKLAEDDGAESEIYSDSSFDGEARLPSEVEDYMTEQKNKGEKLAKFEAFICQSMYGADVKNVPGVWNSRAGGLCRPPYAIETDLQLYQFYKELKNEGFVESLKGITESGKSYPNNENHAKNTYYALMAQEARRTRSDVSTKGNDAHPTQTRRLRIIQINAQGLKSNLKKIKRIVRGADIVSLCETKLHASDRDVDIRTDRHGAEIFKIIRGDMTHSRAIQEGKNKETPNSAGGVAILVKKGIQCTPLVALDNLEGQKFPLELCAVDLKFSGQVQSSSFEFRLISIYNYKLNNTDFKHLLDTIKLIIKDTCLPCFIMGDFNLPHINWTGRDPKVECSPSDSVYHSNYDLLVKFVIKHKLTQVVLDPTYEGRISDLILCTDPSLIIPAPRTGKLAVVSETKCPADHHYVTINLRVPETAAQSDDVAAAACQPSTSKQT